ncbi:hypothetical protein [Nostoc sp.]
MKGLRSAIAALCEKSFRFRRLLTLLHCDGNSDGTVFSFLGVGHKHP